MKVLSTKILIICLPFFSAATTKCTASGSKNCHKLKPRSLSAASSASFKDGSDLRASELDQWSRYRGNDCSLAHSPGAITPCFATVSSWEASAPVTAVSLKTKSVTTSSARSPTTTSPPPSYRSSTSTPACSPPRRPASTSN